MADEIDAGQERGDVAGQGRKTNSQTPGVSPSTYRDLNLDNRRVAEWRALRDAGGGTIVCISGNALKKSGSASNHGVDL